MLFAIKKLTPNLQIVKWLVITLGVGYAVKLKSCLLSNLNHEESSLQTTGTRVFPQPFLFKGSCFSHCLREFMPLGVCTFISSTQDVIILPVVQFSKMIELSWWYHTAVKCCECLSVWHFLHTCTGQINWEWEIASEWIEVFWLKILIWSWNKIPDKSANSITLRIQLLHTQ